MAGWLIVKPFYHAASLAQTNDTHHINISLTNFPSGKELREVYRGRFREALDHFAPQLIMVSAGFDGHVEDDMSGGQFTDDDYAAIGAEIHAVAEQHTDGRVISLLEGGYALSALGRSVVAYLKALL